MTLCFTYAAVHRFSLYSPVIFYSLNFCLPSDIKDYFYQNLQIPVIKETVNGLFLLLCPVMINNY